MLDLAAFTWKPGRLCLAIGQAKLYAFFDVLKLRDPKDVRRHLKTYNLNDNVLSRDTMYDSQIVSCSAD
jgi:hypothetical protein